MTITCRIFLTFSLGNHDHAQLKQGLNWCKGGHEWLVKSYNKLQQEMQDLITCGDALAGTTVPKQLSSEGLWNLDVSDDLWTDLAQDEQFQDGAPRWLYDEPMKQGICTMLDLQCSEEELEQLNHECSVMSTWLQGQAEQLQLTSHIAQGIHPSILPCSYSNLPTTREYPAPLPD